MSNFTVAGTLVLDPGTIIKTEMPYNLAHTVPLSIGSTGKLEANGTAALPVVITTHFDQNYGGDWAPLVFSDLTRYSGTTLLTADGGASVRAVHTVFGGTSDLRAIEAGSSNWSVPNATLDVRDSTFSSGVKLFVSGVVGPAASGAPLVPPPLRLAPGTRPLDGYIRAL